MYFKIIMKNTLLKKNINNYKANQNIFEYKDQLLSLCDFYLLG